MCIRDSRSVEDDGGCLGQAVARSEHVRNRRRDGDHLIGGTDEGPFKLHRGLVSRRAQLDVTLDELVGVIDHWKVTPLGLSLIHI